MTKGVCHFVLSSELSGNVDFNLRSRVFQRPTTVFTALTESPPPESQGCHWQREGMRKKFSHTLKVLPEWLLCPCPAPIGDKVAIHTHTHSHKASQEMGPVRHLGRRSERQGAACP